MSKRFNGRKMSHTRTPKARTGTCPFCQAQLRMFLGALRCTEMKRGKGGDDRRIVRHGSLATINKRLKQQARTAA